MMKNTSLPGPCPWGTHGPKVEVWVFFRIYFLILIYKTIKIKNKKIEGDVAKMLM
jgi:hypothetical protein